MSQLGLFEMEFSTMEETPMSRLKPITKIRVLEKSDLNRNYLFIFMIPSLPNHLSISSVFMFARVLLGAQYTDV